MSDRGTAGIPVRVYRRAGWRRSRVGGRSSGFRLSASIRLEQNSSRLSRDPPRVRAGSRSGDMAISNVLRRRIVVSDGIDTVIRPCGESDIGTMGEIINEAADAYHGAIPADCWHEPYMPESELRSEIAAGVRFVGCEIDGVLAGVMGIQSVRNVELIRHAYVRRAFQGYGVGIALIEHLCASVSGQILVGTWTAARWAVGFYERNGFTLIEGEKKDQLLRTYWSISDRQVETSIVRAKPPLDERQADKLMRAA